jgi:hypothetical protein
MIRTPWERRGNTTRTRVHTRAHAGIGLCNYGGLINTLFTDVEGVA